MSAEDDDELNHRERATLRAVARGQAELTCSCEPDLFVEGLAFSDQLTAHSLVHRGLIAPVRPGRRGELVPAKVTDAGRTALNGSTTVSTTAA
ncbi:hypothetical protein [Haloechinothrix sp. LS1_15]|uniref:hypothetical protein n=1 Tax=Haloechinothrix sp. LS1_15 TaxID=2652248 RepID=UPI0029447A98|nr:hypothetical protein [Haloechinothrix sp. LS1_15]MDV6013419.1 hypothetical protein [Haloechinothrix sp. LS1_15]